MAAVAIAEVSEVEGQRVGAHSPLHHEAEVGLVSAPSPSHVLVMVDELFSRQKHAGKRREFRYVTLLCVCVCVTVVKHGSFTDSL